VPSSSLARNLDLSGDFWNWFENIDINLLGYIIVGMFIVTWGVALSVWPLGRIEERWSPRLDDDHTRPAC
jgi:nickel/cobalt transporter (NiCoT) family protein